MRIDKLLSNSGYGSRKEVKHLLKSGSVFCNDEKITDAKKHVDPDKDFITVHGEQVHYKEFIYLLMNKPAGYISATEDDRLKTVLDILEPEDAIKKPFPVGRLDRDTEGLLVLTNDGQLAHEVLAPKKHVPKTYYAVIQGIVTEKDVELFASGITLDDGYVTKPGQLKILSSGPKSEIELIITEGKFHQVKRMFEAVDKKVIYLKRIKMGELELDRELQTGEYREMSEEEIKLLNTRVPEKEDR